MSLGMNRGTGKPVAGVDHIRQSITDILTTPVGTRVELPEYGSNIPLLVDRPINDLFAVELYSETAQALDRWEPRFKLLSVWIEGRNSTGRIYIGVEGVVKADGAIVRVEGITL